MGGGAWWATVHGISKSWTRLRDFTFTFHPSLLFSSFHFSLRKAFLSLLAILWNTVFIWLYLSLSPWLFPFVLSTAICEASSDNHFAFLYFFLVGWFWSLPPVRHSVHQIYSLESTCHFYCIIIRDLIQVIPEWPSSFLYFLQFKSEFCNRSKQL